MPAYKSMERQSLTPPVRPVCPEAPVWPVEPLLQGVLLRKALIICHACIHPNGTPETAPTCETRLPGSPGLASGAACPCKQSQVLTLCHKPPLLRKALIICHACIHPNGTPETAPTCETRLPGSPCLACGAACPCKQSQGITQSHMPPHLCTKP